VLEPVYVPPKLAGRTDRDIDLTLIAIDDWGASGSDSLVLHVRNVHRAPSVDAGPDRSVYEGEAVHLVGAVDLDEDGWIAGVQWDDRGAGGRFDPSADLLDPTYWPPRLDGCGDVGIGLTLTVTDDLGARGSDDLILLVRNENAAPTVDAGDDREIQGGETVILAAEGYDEDGRISEYRWRQTQGPAVSMEPDLRSATVRFVAPDVEVDETLRFRVTVSDDCGASAFDDLRVEVLPRRAVSSHGSLEVQIDLSDGEGFPLLPWDAVPFGETILIRVAVTNTGQTLLTDLSALLDGGETIGMNPSRLDLWESASIEFEILVEPSLGEDLWEIMVEVCALDPTDSPVSNTESTALYVVAGESRLTLKAVAKCVEAAVGDTVEY